MHTEHMKVMGMSCGGCTSKVTLALSAIPGVSDANVSLSSGEATVQFDEKQTSPSRLKDAVRGAGYDVDEPNANHTQPSKNGCCC